MSGQLTSTGRGGAGNIGDVSKSPRIAPKDLETPTLKNSVVTTGRGGSGNMAHNKDPAETRLRQDVDPVERRPSGGAAHFGRGGAANVTKLSDEDKERARKAESAVDDEQQSASATATAADVRTAKEAPKGHGIAAKGKEWLQHLGKKA